MIDTILLVLAFVCFVLAAIGVRSDRVELVALGLAACVLSVLV